MSKKGFFRGTLILTGAGVLTRLMGFFYRIFLSHAIGSRGMGVYQLLVPLQTLVLAFTSAGIQTALSRMTASQTALGKEKEAGDTFFLGTLCALFLSLLASWTICRHAGFFAAEILKEPETKPLIALMCFGFPISALHACVTGYYFGRGKTGFPSAMQLLEQGVRVGSSWLIFRILLSEGKKPSALIAVGGSLAGEFAVILLCLLFVGYEFHRKQFSPRGISHIKKGVKSILVMAFPLTLNRLLLTLLGSMEVVLIPQRLRMYGMSPSEALSVYGIFTGMALPLILFPSALTNSASVMLMPSVARLQTLGYGKRIRYVISRTCQFCFAMGTLFALLFFFFGNTLGSLLFRSPTAGACIHTLSFICPFLYLNTALSSILHGLGRPGLCLFNNALSISVRIAFVLLAIPAMGIRGYLYGILCSELLRTVLHLPACSFFSIDKEKRMVYNNHRKFSEEKEKNHGIRISKKTAHAGGDPQSISHQ